MTPQIKFGNAKLIEIDGDAGDVMAAARNHAEANGLARLYGNVGMQADRPVFSGSMLVGDFLRYTKFNELKPDKKDYATLADIASVTQRALIPAHVKDIANYLRLGVSTRTPIILPGIVLNCPEGAATIFTIQGTAPHRFAILCMHERAPLTVADGMHRKAAFQEVLEPAKKGERLEREPERMLREMTLSTMVTFEADVDQVRKDFADIASAEPIGANITVAFRKNAVTGFVKDILAAVPFIGQHTATDKAQTGPKSLHAWTLATAARAQGALIAGRRTAIDADILVDKLEAHRQRKVEGDYLAFDAFATAWWTAIQNAFPPYKLMGETQHGAPGFMPGLRAPRDNALILSTTALEIFGALGHALWASGMSRPADIAERLRILLQLDWRPDAKTWLGNVTPAAGHSITQKAALVNDAVKAVQAFVDQHRLDKAA